MAIYGSVRNVKAYPSSGNCVIEVEIPVEFFQSAAQFMGAKTLMTLANLAQPFGVVKASEPDKEPDTKPLIEGGFKHVTPEQAAGKEPAKEPAKHVFDTPPKSHVKHHFPGGLCGLAVRWCADEHFHGWLEDTYPTQWAGALTQAEKNEEMAAKYVIVDMCQIRSRKDLDTSPSADLTFRKYFLGPYSEVRKEHGCDE